MHTTHLATPLNPRFRMHGVTLIELLIVIVVIGILAAIAVPSYRNYVLRAQRTDAMSALLRVAAAQEKFYLQNNTYADDDALADDPPAGLGISSTENGWYDLYHLNRVGAGPFSGWLGQEAGRVLGPLPPVRDAGAGE